MDDTAQTASSPASAGSPTRSSRQGILDRIRSRRLPEAALPEIDAARLVRYDDLADAFCQSAEIVGASVRRVANIEQAHAHLETLDAYRDAAQVASTVNGIEGNFDPASTSAATELASLDWMVINGRLGVAENGAVWVPADEVHDRTQIFITQHLAIVLDTAHLVPHMHEAYQRIGRFRGYGVFVSGPSKTADIEQSLVLGAHGCRTLTILLLDAASPSS